MILVFLSVARALVSPPPRVRPLLLRPSSVAPVAESKGDRKWMQSAETVSLIAGASVGSGFLALPRAAAQLGPIPTYVALGASWTYLLACTLALAEGTLRTRAAQREREGSYDEGASIFSVASEALGGASLKKDLRTRIVLGLAAACFVAGILATLSAQIAKARGLGMLLFPGFPTTFVVSALSYYLAFGVSARFAERASAALGVSMFLSFIVMLKGVASGFAGVAASGGIAAMAPAAAAAASTPSNWAALLPFAGAARNGDPWPMSVFCQLLCFSEVVAVASRSLLAEPVNASPRRLAATLSIGGFVPLAMALALVAVGGSGFAGLLGGGKDPVDVLVSSGGALAAGSVVLFAATAIATTAIAGLLTASQFVSDFLCDTYGYCSLRQRRVVRICSVALPALVSYSSPDFFYTAMAFAGAIPVCFLWGVLPSFLLTPLRKRRRSSNDNKLAILPGGAPFLTFLKLSSLLLFGVNLSTYLGPLLSTAIAALF